MAGSCPLGLASHWGPNWPQGKGLPPPWGGNSVWGIGSASQHTVIPLLRSLWERKSLRWHRCKGCSTADIEGIPSSSTLPQVRVWTASATIPAEFSSNKGSKMETCSQSCVIPTSMLQNHHKERCEGPCKPSPALLWGCGEMGCLALPPGSGPALRPRPHASTPACCQVAGRRNLISHVHQPQHL